MSEHGCDRRTASKRRVEQTGSRPYDSGLREKRSLPEEVITISDGEEEGSAERGQHGFDGRRDYEFARDRSTSRDDGSELMGSGTYDGDGGMSDDGGGMMTDGTYRGHGGMSRSRSRSREGSAEGRVVWNHNYHFDQQRSPHQGYSNDNGYDGSGWEERQERERRTDRYPVTRSDCCTCAQDKKKLEDQMIREFQKEYDELGKWRREWEKDNGERMKEITDENQSLKKKLHDMTVKYSKLESSYNTGEILVDTVMSDKKNDERELAEKEEMADENQNLRKNLHDMTVKYSKLQEHTEGIEEGYAQLQTHYEMNEILLNTLTTDAEKLERELADKVKDFDEVKAQLAARESEWKETNESKERILAEPQNCASNAVKLEEDNNRLKERKKEQGTMDSMDRQLKSIQQELSELKQKEHDLMTENLRLTLEKKGTAKELEALKAKEATMGNLYMELEEVYAQLAQRKSEWQEKEKGLNLEIATRNEQIEKKVEELIELQNENVRLAEEKEKAVNELETLKAKEEATNVDEGLEEARVQFALKESEWQEKEEKLHLELSTRDDRIAKLMLESSELETERRRMEEEKEKTMERLERLERLEGVEAELAAAKEKEMKLENELKDMDHHHVKIESEWEEKIREMESDLKESQELVERQKKELMESEAGLQRVQEKHKETLARLEGMEDEMSKIKDLMTNSKQQGEKTMEDMETVQAVLTPGDRNKDKELEEMKAQLEETKTQLEEMNAQLASKGAEWKEKEKQRELLEQHIMTYEELEKTMQEELNQTKERVVQLQSELVESQKEVESMREKIAEMEFREECLKNRLMDLDEEKNALKIPTLSDS